MHLDTFIIISYVISLLTTFFIKSSWNKYSIIVGATIVFIVFYLNNLKMPTMDSGPYILIIFTMIFVGGVYGTVISDGIANIIVTKRLKRKYKQIVNNPTPTEVFLFNLSYEEYLEGVKKRLNKSKK